MKLAFMAMILSFLLLIAGCPQQEAPAGGAGPELNATPPAEEEPVELVPGVTARPEYLNETWFEDLPPFPTDLYKLRNQIRYGEFWDMASIGEEYYKQPEFYPTFEQIGLPLLQSPSGITPWGMGAYPGDIQVITFPKDNFTVATFFMSSWGVQSYQGIGFSVSYHAQDASVSSADVASYFDVEVSPNAVYLGPTHGKFDYNWTNKVVVDVKVKKEAKVGTYYINLDVGKPPGHLSAYWGSQFGSIYTEGGGIGTSVGRPYFRLTITVT